MTQEEIRKNAPSGATHYIQSGGHIWYFKNPKKWMIYYRHEWALYGGFVFGFDMSKAVSICTKQ